MFNEFEKFFDKITIEKLIADANLLNYQLGELALCIAQHTAPRVIQSIGACSRPIEIFNSMLAGCSFSIALTRAYLMADFKQLVTNNPDAKISTFVDGAPIHAPGNKYDLFQILVQAGLEFKDITSKPFLVLSGKAEIVCLCPLLAKKVANELEKIVYISKYH